ncbi:MAG: PH domain-containing protein [Oscillospiraceae bacterium]
MNNNKTYHAHPIQIFSYISRLLVWLIIPLVRGLISALTGGLISWLSGAWIDIMVLISILGIGIIQWWLTVFTFDEGGVSLEKGIFLHRKTYIPSHHILSVLITKSFYLRPLRAVQLRLDTSGGSFNQADFNFIVKKSLADKMADMLVKDPSGKRIIQKSNLIYILALSLITSNSFAGIMIITTFISSLGEVLGEELSKRIYGTFRQFSNALAFGIPPAAAALAYLLFIGWFVTFTANVIRYRNLTVTRQGLFLNIKGGLFTISEYTLKPKSISYVDIRQTLLTKILRLHSVFIYAIGYGKSKTDVSAVIPAIRQKNLNSNIKKLIPKFNKSERTLKPNFGALMRFITDPIYFCIGILLVTFVLILVYPDWKDFLSFIAGLALVPAIWFLAVRFIDFCTSGISKSKGCYTIRYSRSFYLHTVIIPEDKIVTVKTKQSYLQKFDKKCDVYVFTYSEGMSCHKCRNLNKSDVLELFDL